MYNLINVEKPSRYTAGEFNQIVKDHEKMKSSVAFCFPDTYEIGMSHLGMKILYHIINLREDSVCERVFAPWTDMEKKMLDEDIALFSLETKKDLKDFDFLAFTLQYEMSYTNILNMLFLAKVPFLSKDRRDTDPLIMAGGPCAVNPAPLDEIVDIFIIGDGEEVINEILDLYESLKEENKDKEYFLKKVSDVEGVYVPKYYKAKKKVKKRLVKDLNTVPYPTKPIVPYINVVHDRASLELFRGCIRGCRFCQAGFTYRPVRERSKETLLKQTKEIIENTGYEEIGMLSLSTSDYSELEDLCTQMLEYTQENMVNISVPSMRIDNFSIDFMNKIQKVRKSSLTFAPEAGSQRLRDVINKNITEEEILNAVELAKKGGYEKIKLYFMLGLPTETDEDVIAIADLAHKILNKMGNLKRASITVSTSFFIPKAFTPFQWCEQISVDEMIRKQKLLSSHIKSKKIKYNWHDFNTSIVESAISRGDKRINKVLINAWEEGAKFDSWYEFFDMSKWIRAFEKEGLDIYKLASQAIALDETLPWDFIDIGVRKSYLLKEYEKAHKETTTTDCREKCTNCGVAKYKTGVCFEDNQIKV